MKTYSLDWWWEQYEMSHMYFLTSVGDEQWLRFRTLTTWIRKRITAKIIQYEREIRFPDEDLDLITDNGKINYGN
jgi:hypothetical protein